MGTTDPRPIDHTEFDLAVTAHDAALADRGLEIWVGNEPTFTDRYSAATEWLTGAVGDDKTRRAEALLAALAAHHPGSAVIRSIGRQYPGESEPRSSIGLYARRDGEPVWRGPPDPLVATASDRPPHLAAFHAAIAGALGRRGFVCRPFLGFGDVRHVFARAGNDVLPDPNCDERLLRSSVHAAAIPPGGLADDLARQGLFLLILGEQLYSGRTVACVDVPAVPRVDLFLELLAVLAEAATGSSVDSLVLRGFPPPVDATVVWSTVTPDPAVVEVNAAPSPDVAAFLRSSRACYAAAASLGLAPYRLHYNGAVADSGGGGQITFGGPLPARSPFFVQPRLLPRLVRYVTRHPSLSYLYAHDHVGACGQSVRPDEIGADTFAELRLAVALLAHEAKPTPPLIWATLAPFLTDPTGNSHRAEINVEKLWNPAQPGRGMLGLVEFRAFRMQHTPERAAALAALVRATLARLMAHDDALDALDLVEWNTALHDRFSLPFYLHADLREILDDLQSAGLGLAPALTSELEADHWRQWVTLELGECTLQIRQGLEFPLLLGDALSQQGTSRMVDASTSRIEVALRSAGAAGGAEPLAAWGLRANDVELPLRTESDPLGPVRVFGIRHRSFLPRQGLHPTLPAQTPLRLTLSNPAWPQGYEVALHEWAPDGAAYDGVPADLGQASRRRAARCVVTRVPLETIPPPRPASPGALSPYTLDARYPPGPHDG
jgi:uncharacterized protein (DUF2126 family)